MSQSLAQLVEAVWSSRSMGAVLLDASFKATVVLTAAAVAGMLVRKGSASGRHLVWSLAVFAALSLPLLALVLPSWRVEVVQPASREAAPGLVDPVPVVVAVPQPVTAEATREWKWEKAEPVWHSVRVKRMPHASRRVSVTSVVEPGAAQASAMGGGRLQWAEALLGVWAVGALLLLTRVVVGRVQVKRLASRAVRVKDHRAVLCHELCAVLGIGRVVTLFESSEPVLPMTWGVLRPTVLLPDGSREWSRERVQLVLLHELAHVRRFDALTQLFAQLACALYWFHPLVWIASRRMHALREYACDDQVLRAGRRPSEYAGELLEMVRALQPRRGIAASTLPMAQRSQLQERLMAILDPSVRRSGFTRRSATAVVLGAALVVVPLAVVQPAVAQPPTPDGAPAQEGAPVPAEAPAAKPSKTLPRLSKSESEKRVAPAPIPAQDPRSAAAPAPAADPRNAAEPAQDARNAAPPAQMAAPTPPAPPAPGVAVPLPPRPPNPENFDEDDVDDFVEQHAFRPPTKRRADPSDERAAMEAMARAERETSEERLQDKLEDIAKEYNFDEEATRQRFLQLTQKLKSDERHSEALVAFLRGAPVSVEAGREVLRQASQLKDDEARSEVLEFMHRIKESELVRGPLANDYLNAAEGIRSDEQLADVLKSQLHPEPVAKGITVRSLKIAERIKDDDGKEDVLREVSDHQQIDAEVEAAYRRLADSIRDSDTRNDVAERLADAKRDGSREGRKRRLVIRSNGKTFTFDKGEFDKITAEAWAKAKKDVARARDQAARALAEFNRDQQRAQRDEQRAGLREEMAELRAERQRLAAEARELKRREEELKARMRERGRELRRNGQNVPEDFDSGAGE